MPDLVWLLLIGLTLGGAFLAEAVESGFRVTVIIAAIMAHANRTIRKMVRLYGLAIPLLLVLTYVFCPQIALLISL